MDSVSNGVVGIISANLCNHNDWVSFACTNKRISRTVKRPNVRYHFDKTKQIHVSWSGVYTRGMVRMDGRVEFLINPSEITNIQENKQWFACYHQNIESILEYLWDFTGDVSEMNSHFKLVRVHRKDVYLIEAEVRFMMELLE